MTPEHRWFVIDSRCRIIGHAAKSENPDGDAYVTTHDAQVTWTGKSKHLHRVGRQLVIDPTVEAQ